MLKKDTATDLKTIASWMNMEHSRICQIMNLLLLAPAIQNEIICSEDKRLFQIPECKIRDILRELHWAKQLEIWRSLLQDHPTSPKPLIISK